MPWERGRRSDNIEERRGPQTGNPGQCGTVKLRSLQSARLSHAHLG